MLQPLDGPSTQGTLSSVGTVTVVEAIVGGSAFPERKVVTLQGVGRFYVYFGDLTVGAPSAATVSSDGFLVFKNAQVTYEATNQQPIYVLAVTGTVDIKIAERA